VRAYTPPASLRLAPRSLPHPKRHLYRKATFPPLAHFSAAGVVFRRWHTFLPGGFLPLAHYQASEC